MNRRTGIAMALLFFAALPALAGPNEVRRINGEGNRLYTEEEWAEALETYREAAVLDPQNPVLHYNLGNALFRLNDLDEAETHYRAAAAAEDGDLARQARFNLGNTAFRRAETLESAGDWQGRNQALGKAIEHWKSVLESDPADRDAKRNLELAWRKLRETPPENQQQEQDRQRNEEQDEQNQEQQEQPQDGEQGEEEQEQQQSEDSDDEQKEQADQQEQPQANQEQRQEEQQQQQVGEEKQDEQAGEQQEARISEEEARRILDALRDEEMEEQKRQLAERKAKGGSAEKDW